MSQQYPFFDRTTGQYYTYDAASDAYIFQDGSRQTRPREQPPPSIPRYTGSDLARQSTTYGRRAPSVSSNSRSVTSAAAAAAAPSYGNPSSTTSTSRDISYTYGTTQPPGSPQSVASAPNSQRPGQTAPRGGPQPELQALNDSFGSLNIAPPTAGPSAVGPGSSPRRLSVSSQDQGARRQYPQQATHHDTRQGQGSLAPSAAVSSRTSETGVSTRTVDDLQRRLRITEAYNPVSQVWTRIATRALNPRAQDRITESGLYQSRITADNLLLGVGAAPEGEPEKLYSSFKVRPHSFFCIGRVFLVLWVEPAGSTAITNLVERNDNVLPGRYPEEFIYSKVRRFVVVRAGHEYCSALPIVSYGYQGVGKANVKKSEHAIIYTGNVEPKPLSTEMPQRGEAGMRHNAIRVVVDDPTDKLDGISRIDFGKVSTVQHNIKAKALGMVHPASMSALQTQFMNVWYGEALTETILNNHRTAQPSDQVQPRAGGQSVREVPPPLNTAVPEAPRSHAESQGQASVSATGGRSSKDNAEGGSNVRPGTVESQRRGSQMPSGSQQARPTRSAPSRGAPSVAGTEARWPLHSSANVPTQEDSKSEDDEDDEDEAVAPRGSSSTRAGSNARQPSSRSSAQATAGSQASTSLSTEARSAQNAYQNLTQRGFSRSEAVDQLTEMYMASNSGLTRDGARMQVIRLLQYRG